MNKDLIKYALIGVGVYLIYRYAQSSGWLTGILPAGAPAPGPAYVPPATYTPAPAPAPTPASVPVNPPPPGVPLLDVTGLVVTRDVNDSLAGTVKIAGVPIRLAIIQTDGRIFNNAGQDVTAQLTAQGVDVNYLRAAFTAAGAGLSGLRPVYSASAAWLM